MKKSELIASIQQAGQAESRLSLLFRHQLANRAGLHITDMECMDFILNNKEVTPGQLSKATGLSSGAMTALLGRLEKQKMIRRRYSPEDGRKVYISANMKEAKRLFSLYDNFVKNATALLHTYSKVELELILGHYAKMSDIYAQELRSNIK